MRKPLKPSAPAYLESISILMGTLIPTTSVEAHESHMGSQEVFQALVSDVNVRVLAIPIVGNVHMTIHVAYPESSTNIEKHKLK